MQQFYLGKLWDANTNAFRDRPQVAGFVPNKAATACLALFGWSECSGEAEWAEHYALPNLERLLAYQVQGGKLHGAIAQNSIGGQTVAKYMPLYIARWIPALLKGYQWTHHEATWQPRWRRWTSSFSIRCRMVGCQQRSIPIGRLTAGLSGQQHWAMYCWLAN